jgi:hypothetical protein
MLWLYRSCLALHSAMAFVPEMRKARNRYRGAATPVRRTDDAFVTAKIVAGVRRRKSDGSRLEQGFGAIDQPIGDGVELDVAAMEVVPPGLG